MKESSQIWRPFGEARAFVHTLQLKSRQEWQTYCQSGEKPNDIPSAPREVYENKFEGWGDWLGTGYVATQLRTYLSFKEARAFVHQLGFKNQKQWRLYCKSTEKPANIPSAPDSAYGSEFQGFGDWLGTGVVGPHDHEYRSFAEAHAFVQQLGLSSRTQWRSYCNAGERPPDIPSAPDRVYGTEFQGWGDWLGTGTIAHYNRTYRSFEEARSFVHTLHLENREAWRAYCQSGEKPNDIPSDPRKVYKREFQGLGDWLGTGYVANTRRTYRPFKGARSFVQALRLKNGASWNSYCKSGQKPDDIPSDPGQVYKDVFQGMGDWLGTGYVANTRRTYRPFEEARAFVHTLEIKSLSQWKVFCDSGNKPEDIPANVSLVYKNKFQGWGDWLGTGTIAPFKREYRSFEKARSFIHTLHFTNREEWRTYCQSGKKPDDIPSTPNEVYKDAFKGMADWLGIGPVSMKYREYLSFEEARTFVHTLALTSRAKWSGYCRSKILPENVPSNPYHIYGHEFQGWGDWLGTGYVANQYREYLPFEDARAFVHTLKLKNVPAWRVYCRIGEKPENIPSDPFRVYRDQFLGMEDWLGTGTLAPRNREYRPFAEARDFVHRLGLKNRAEWQAYCKTDEKPEDIPTSPSHTYRSAFRGWGDWLGTGNIAPFNRDYRSFYEARAFVHTLKLKSKLEWNEYCNSKRKPTDIPTTPERTYSSEFKGYGDWLGTGTIAPQLRTFLSFDEAHTFVLKLRLEKRAEWKKYCASGEKPDNIPSNPQSVYKDEFQGWGDWLGTGTIAARDRVYRSYEEAKGFVQTLALKNGREWTQYCVSGAKPADIPTNPSQVYGSEYKGIGDWLGTGTVAFGQQEFLPFEEARSFVHTLKLKSRAEWDAYYKSGKKPNNIPSGPRSLYGNEFKGWGDWLGTGFIAGRDRIYLPFEEARAFVRALGLKNRADWNRYCKSGEKPDNIPGDPYRAYEGDFLGMGNWLGTERIANQLRVYRSFQEARTFVHALQLPSQRAWLDYCKSGEKPANIPSVPSQVYPSEYMGMGDWLGTDISDELPEMYTRQKDLEKALFQLHSSQLLSAGQIMILMRHAGTLSKQRYLHTVQRLQHSVGQPSDKVQTHLLTIEAAIEEADEETNGKEDEAEWEHIADQTIHTSEPEEWGPSPINQSSAPESQTRNREVEVRELRGWSAIGNLLDPSPALVQLSVTRLKTAFYRFAHDLRGTLAAPQHTPSLEEIDLLKQDIWDAAFGEYGDLINNELIQEACQIYAADLAEALLLPWLETGKVPRLYQLDGARFLSQRLCSQTHPYGLLFDQPGMGKTLTTLWALATANIERFIIVAPLTVKTQVWTQAELQVAFPLLEEDHVARTLDGALQLPAYGPAVALLHYEELRKHNDIQQLVLPRTDGSLPFEALIFDEAHNVKERLVSGTSAQRAGAWLLRKGAQACIGLTATPVVNELYEPVSLLHLVQHQQDITAGKQLQSRRLRDRVDVMEYLLTDSLRRLKDHVLFEIPPRHIEPIAITPTGEELKQIQAFLSRDRRSVGSSLSVYRRMMLDIKLGWVVDRVHALNCAETPTGAPDPKVLILCCNVEGVSQSVYTHLVTHFGPERIAHIEGMTPQRERDTILKRFRSSGTTHTDLTVLVGTIGTIGVGVTLFDPAVAVTPHRVIVADLPFTWAEFEQGVDRLHRVGQRHHVQVEVPLVSYGDQLTSIDGRAIQSFDEWVWEWICRKQVLSDQVLDAEFDISAYKDSAVRRAISQTLKDIETAGGTVFAPPPPPESAQAEHRRLIGRYRALSRHRVAEYFREPGASERFLALNDTSPSAKLAQRLVRERLAQWLDKRSIVVDLGCGSNPLHDLVCAQVIGIDRHGVGGGLIGDSTNTGLPSAEADFVIFSLSMWGTPQDRLCYLQEAKRILRPIGKLIIVEPAQTFGSANTRKLGLARLSAVLERLGMQIASASDHIVDSGTHLIAIVINNSNKQVDEHIEPEDCIWAIE